MNKKRQYLYVYTVQLLDQDEMSVTQGWCSQEGIAKISPISITRQNKFNLAGVGFEKIQFAYSKDKRRQTKITKYLGLFTTNARVFLPQGLPNNGTD
jgi:hypothetical protein